MKLTKAIEILKWNLQYPGTLTPQMVREAEQLGIEAGERIQVGRNNPGTHWNEPLPGETPE